MSLVHYMEEGGVGIIALESPKITQKLVRDLNALCDRLEDDSACRLVVFRGAEPDFCLGLDLDGFYPTRPADIDIFSRWEKLCTRIERLPKITVAALQGEARGAGAQLVLLCDLRFATRDAQLIFDELEAGMLPGMSTFRLAKSIGLSRAKRVFIQRLAISAERALEWGVIDEICDDLASRVAQAVEEVAGIEPTHVQLTRRLLNESFEFSFEDAIGHFLAAQHLCKFANIPEDPSNDSDAG
ncbi:MAG: enoyl-CoA hydratase/isomerase family protein [Candidatus Competibacterales bacterium]